MSGNGTSGAARGRVTTHRARHSHAGAATARSGLMWSGKILASVLSLVLLVGFGYGWYEYRSLNGGLQHFHLTHLADPQQDPGPSGTGTGTGSTHVNGVEQNILIVGIDSRGGLSHAERHRLSVGNATSLSTDTIMIVHVPANGARATLISIPRDSYVDIPGGGGYAKNKINAAYADAYGDATGTKEQKEAAGANELIATVTQLTGLSINHYIQVGFGGFYTISKAIKGISVDLCASTDDTFAHNQARGLGRVGSNFKASAGWHTLTPVQSLEFVRQRHNLHGKGDIAREKRQRYFLAQAFSKIASAGVLLNPVELDHLINAIKGSFYIDDNDFSLADLAEQMTNLSSSNIIGYTIPTEGNHRVNIVGTDEDVEIVDPAKVRSALAEILAGKAPRIEHSPSGETSPSSSPSGPPTPGGAASTRSQPKADAGCVY